MSTSEKNHCDAAFIGFFGGAAHIAFAFTIQIYDLPVTQFEHPSVAIGLFGLAAIGVGYLMCNNCGGPH